jgi:hypothetical protein
MERARAVDGVHHHPAAGEGRGALADRRKVAHAIQGDASAVRSVRISTSRTAASTM